MKKIGILTYHRSINYGAVMQAYSFSERLAKEFPEYKIEIIDYMSENADMLYHPKFMNYMKLAARKNNLHQKAIMVKQGFIYLKHRMSGRRDYKLNAIFENQLKAFRLSEKTFVTDDENSFFEKINGEYDAIIVGSDAVFNWQIRSFPNPYFLAGDIGACKLSYAASSYGQEFLQITNKQKEYIKKAWNGFDYLGVRDNATEEFIKYIDKSLIPHHNCDPTVFLNLDDIPVSDNELKGLLVKKGVDFTKPVIGIMAQDWLGKLVRDIFGDKYQIVAVFKDNPYADIYINYLTPFQWSKIFRFFDLTFTHFFHGNLLSLKNGTPTIIIENRSPYNAAHNSKVRDFMARAELSDFCFYSCEIEEKKDEIVQAVKDRIENPTVYK